jgi:hypothetical protein
MTDEVKEFKFKHFDMSKMKTDAIVLLLGKRGSGKSVLMKEIFHKRQQTLSYGLVISGTENVNKFYSDFIPPLYIHNEYIPDNVARAFHAQNKIIFKQGKTKKNNMFVCLDDCLGDDAIWKKDKVFKKLIFEGRHSNIFLALLLQYCKAIPPGFRTNIDYIFLFFYPDHDAQKNIYDNFGGMFGSFNEFKTAYEALCKDHHCMVIDRTVSSPKSVTDSVFIYKANIVGDFKIGDARFWTNHYRKYDENWLFKDTDSPTPKKILKFKNNIIISTD